MSTILSRSQQLMWRLAPVNVICWYAIPKTSTNNTGSHKIRSSLVNIRGCRRNVQHWAIVRGGSRCPIDNWTSRNDISVELDQIKTIFKPEKGFENVVCKDGSHFLDFNVLIHLPLDKMAAISQTIFSDAFSCMKNLAFFVSVCLCVRVCVYQSRVCPHDNSPLVQARITKFGTEVQKTLVKVPIVFRDDRPWPSRSNLIWKSNFTSFWACPHHNSSAVEARITKFGPKMHLSTVNIPINFGYDWFWSSPSFLILKPIFLPNLFALFLHYI